jgi:hypothetical protein
MKSVQIYMSPNSEETQRLVAWIRDNIDDINRVAKISIKQTLVTSKNKSAVIAMGITKLPTLVFQGKARYGVQEIIKILKPPAAQRENYGQFATAEEMLQKYQENAMRPGGSDDEEEESTDNQRKMRLAALAKRRSSMVGAKNNPDSFGKKTKGEPQNRKYNNDEDFMTASKVEIDETPIELYEEDGDMLLENMKNEEADAMGRKPFNVKRKPSP